MNPAAHIFVRVALTLVFAVLLASSACGDDTERPAAAPSQPSPGADAASLDVEIVQSVLGETSPRPNGTRYLATQVRAINNTDAELAVPVSDVRLRVYGEELQPQFHPAGLQGFAFETRDESIRFRDLEQPQEIRLPPAETRTLWIVFADLPGSGDVPEMELEIALPDGRRRVSINEAHREWLHLTCRRIGPRGVLGLCTISGSLDTINVGTLVEELNRLSNRGASRTVVSFAESAAPLPDLLRQWLEQTAQQRDRSRIQARFPAVSPTIRELHLASLPEGDGRAGGSSGGRPHVHRTEAEAVEWALEPIIRLLTADEVVEQIERGHPLARAAVLAVGGRQLSGEHLPLILKLAGEADDPHIQRGALLALSEFGQPEAVECLVAHARGRSPEVRTLAVECLAASRFEPAHKALERLLSAPSSVPLADVGRILARYPRARWIEPLRQLAAGEWTEDGASTEVRAEVRREALEALSRIGHPEIVDLLGEALAAEEEPVRQTAFTLLMDRTDEASERMAVEYALELTRDTFPNQQMLSLFQRVRDRRAVPLLIEYLESTASDRSLLIKTLAHIGPSSIDRTLADHFDRLHPREQATALSSLSDLGSPIAFALARQGIAGDDGTIFHPSVRALQQTGTPEAVAVLSDALLETSHAYSSKTNSLIRALEGIGTNDALNALRRARYAGDSRTEQRILSRLVDILQRSPGFSHVQTANDYAQNEQWPEAVNAYSTAIEINPELSDAYSGRGHCRLHLEQLQAAGDDFRSALRGNRYDSLAVTGLAIVLVREGNLDEGMQMVDEAGDRFPHDWLFAYNAACVYGRALEATLQNPPSAERETQVAELQSKAVTQLRMAVERGFDQFDFMNRDPDLAPLRSLDEFQELASPAAEPPNP